MNKLFKVIWSKSKQCYIVVSEVAKNTTGKKKIVVASVLAALTIGAQVATVEAAIEEGTTSNGGAVAVGPNTKASADSSTALGKDVDVSRRFSLGVGFGINVSAENAVGIGSGARYGTVVASGSDSIAVGTRATASRQSAIAMGRLSRSENGDQGIAIGNEAVSGATAAIAIGNKVSASANGAVTIGNESKSTGEAAAAYGNKAQATGASATAVGNQAQATAGSTVAVGDQAKASGANATALGKSSEASQDSALAAGNGASATATGTVAVGKNASASGVQSVAIGSSGADVAEAPAASGIQSIAIGTKTVANSSNAIAMGSTATASGTAATAIGTDVLAKEHGATAIGNQVKVETNKAVGIGFQINVRKAGSTNIGYTSDNDANQAVAIGARNSVTADAQYGTAVGYFTRVTAKNAVAIGSSNDNNGNSDDGKVLASAESAVAIGTSAHAEAASAVGIGTRAKAQLAHSVALGEGSTTTAADGTATTGYLTNDAVNNTGNGIISVGNGSNIVRRITSVASGTNDNDAVNVKQLKALRNASLSTVTVVNGATSKDLVPNTTEGAADANKVKLVAGKNITLTANGNSVTIDAKGGAGSIESGNSDAISVNTSADGKVTVTPNLASNVNAAGDANKLVTAGKVKEALADKVSNDTLNTELAKKANAADVTNLTNNKLDKTAELHVKKGTYAVATDGSVTLDKADGTGTVKADEAVKITGLASKAKLDELKTAVDGKADKSYVDTELGKKASTADMNAALADKVSTAKLNEELGKKANASDITNLTADKVSKADELHVKKGTYDVSDAGTVTLKKVNGTGAEAATEDVIIQGLARKTEITAINTELAKKVSKDDFAAEKNRVNTELGKKLDTATFEAEKATLATRDDINSLKDVIANKLDKDTADKFIAGMGNKVSTEDLNKKLAAADKANSDKLDAAKEELNNAITNATADKVSKADELHVAPDTYEVDQTAGTVTLRQENGLNEPKADKNFTISGIATKKDVTDLTTKINAKADQTALDALTTEVGKKADAADVTEKLAKKADAATVTAELAKKADADTVNAAIANMSGNKVDKTDELHVKTGNPYTVDADGNVTLKQENGEGTEAAGKDIVIEGIASKANLDALKDRVDTAEGKIDTLTDKVADNKDKLGKLDEKLTDVKALADENKGKVDGLKTKVDGIDAKVKENGKAIEKAKEDIQGIKDDIRDNYATNASVGEKIKELKNDLGNNTTLSFAGDETKKAGDTPDSPDTATDKLSLNLKDGVLKVKGEESGEIKTIAKGDTITVGLSQDVKDKLAKIDQLGDTSSEGRDGKAATGKDADDPTATAADKGLTGKAGDGLNGKSLTDKINALRNGEAGSVVYTDADGNRLVKANDGHYYLAKDVDKDGNKVGAAKPVKDDDLKASVMNPDGKGGPTALSNLKDGKVAAGSKDAVTGHQLHGTADSIATALGGGASVNADGTVTAPTYEFKDKDGNVTATATNVGEGFKALNDKLNEAHASTNADIDALRKMENLAPEGEKKIKELAAAAIDVKGDGKAINVSKKSDGDKTVFEVSLSPITTIGGPSLDEHGNPVPKKNKDGEIERDPETGEPIIPGKNDVTVRIDGHAGVVSSGKADKAVSMNGMDGTITAGDLNTGTFAKLDGTTGSVIANTGNFGAPVDTNGVPTEKNATAVSMGKDGLSVISTDENGKALTPITIKNGKITGLQPGTKGDDVATVGQVKEAIGKTTEVLEKTAQRVDQVGAHSAALAAMNPLSYDPLRKSQIMAGIGSYAGNQALALGIAHYANENFMVNAGFTMGAGKSMANLGATYRFGSGEHDDLPERYKGGPISSVYVMQDEIAELKAENARKDAENAEMKAQIKMLMQRMGLA